MEREYRVLKALEGTDVPVPRVYCLCTDISVLGTPFYVRLFMWPPFILDCANQGSRFLDNGVSGRSNFFKPQYSGGLPCRSSHDVTLSSYIPPPHTPTLTHIIQVAFCNYYPCKASHHSHRFSSISLTKIRPLCLWPP